MAPPPSTELSPAQRFKLFWFYGVTYRSNCVVAFTGEPIWSNPWHNLIDCIYHRYSMVGEQTIYRGLFLGCGEQELVPCSSQPWLGAGSGQLGEDWDSHNLATSRLHCASRFIWNMVCLYIFSLVFYVPLALIISSSEVRSGQLEDYINTHTTWLPPSLFLFLSLFFPPPSLFRALSLSLPLLITLPIYVLF